MPARKDYPIPKCPKCGEKDSRVLNTYYGKDFDEIIRLRECNFCEHRLYTEQPAETALDPDVYRVVFPKFTSKTAKYVEVRHKSQDTPYRERKARLAARANGEPQPTRWNREPSYKMQPPEG